MKVNYVTFYKKDGSLREMKFVELEDLPAEFLDSKIKGVRSSPLPPPFKLVWDVEAKDFRTYSVHTIVGEIIQKDEMIVL
jgi:hypothetical protein